MVFRIFFGLEIRAENLGFSLGNMIQVIRGNEFGVLLWYSIKHDKR